MCFSQTAAPQIPPLPPAAPPLPEPTASDAELPLGEEERRRAAAQIGVGNLRIPLSNVNIPR